MNRSRCLRIAAFALPLLTGAPGASPQAPSSQAPTFPSGVELVIVDVVVLDGKGNPVAGLDQQDFTVQEDGVPQQVTTFDAVGLKESEAAPPPARSRVSTNVGPAPRPERSFVVVFDNANISAENAPRAREAVTTFLTTGLHDGDQVTIVPTAGGAWWTGRLPEGRGDLEAFLARLSPKWVPESGGGRISDWEAMQIYFGRDPRILSQVARRWYENGLLMEVMSKESRTELPDVNPGLPLIQAKALDIYTQSTHRLRATLDTLERVATSLAGLRGRKAILLVSDGFVYDNTQTEFRDLVRAARTANAVVYFIDSRGLQGTLGKGGLPGGGAEFMNPVEEQDTLAVLGQSSMEANGARTVAYDTGGAVVSNTYNLAPAMKRIAEESRSYYLLGYVPANTKRDGKFRKITVEVRTPQVTVRARRGYYASTADEKPRKKDELDPRVRTALDAPYAGAAIPLRLTSYVFGTGADGKAAVLLAAEAEVAALGLRQGSDGRYTDVLESFVLVASRDTGENFSQEKLIELSLPPEVKTRMEQSGLPIFRNFNLPAGAYQARLLVRDRESGRTGTVRHEFTVDAPNAFRVSTPILTDTVQADAAGAPPRPIPIARAQFKPGSRLYSAYEVYGAAKDPATGSPRVSTSYEVRRADGSSFTAQGLRPVSPGAQGQIAQLLAIGLQGAAPGEYDLVLTVRDEVAGKTLEVREAFTVVG